jgi:hypothetical protein
LLIASFFIASLGLFLLLVQGKKITLEGEIVESGLVRVQTIPGNVTIYINGNRATKSGSLIQNVPLGDVTVVAQKEGYTPWENTVKVESGRVTELFIQLFPEELSIEQLSTFEIDTIEYASDLSAIYFTVLEEINDAIPGIWKLQISAGLLDFGRSSQPELVYQFTNEELALLTGGDYEMSLSPNSSQMLFEHETNAQYIISLDNGNQKLDLIDYLGFEAQDINWLNNNTLIARQNELLLEIDITEMQHRFIAYTQDNPLIYCKNGDTIYWANQKSDSVFRYQSGVSVPVEVLDISFFNIQSLYCAPNSSSILVVEDNNGLRYIDTQLNLTHTISAGLTVSEISPNGRSLILNDGSSSFVYRIKLEQNNTNIQGTLYRVNATGLNPFFSFSDNRIVYIADSMIGLNSVLLSDNDGANQVPILSDVSIEKSGIAISPNNKEIYLLMSVQNPEFQTPETQPLQTLYKISLD